MCSCSLHIIGLTSLHCCCATLLRLSILRSSIPTHALSHHRAETTQLTAQLTTSRGGATLAVLATNTMQADDLPSSGRQSRLSRAIRPGQQCRRTEPTHQQVEQLPAGYTPRKHDRHPSLPPAAAGTGSFAIVVEERDGTHESNQLRNWLPFCLFCGLPQHKHQSSRASHCMAHVSNERGIHTHMKHGSIVSRARAAVGKPPMVAYPA
jgi:hypothetical protein